MWKAETLKSPEPNLDTCTRARAQEGQRHGHPQGTGVREAVFPHRPVTRQLVSDPS